MTDAVLLRGGRDLQATEDVCGVGLVREAGRSSAGVRKVLKPEALQAVGPEAGGASVVGGGGGGPELLPELLVGVAPGARPQRFTATFC